MSKERYINLSDRQVKDTQNQSQDFLSIKTICRLLNNQDQKIADLEAKLAEMTEKYNACQEARKLEIEFNQQDKRELKQQIAEKDELLENYKMGYTGKVLKKQNKEISVLKSVVKDKDEIIDKLNKVISDLSYTVNNDANNSLYILEKVNDLKNQLAEKEKKHIEDKIYLLEFLKANFADVYIYGVMKTDNYDRSKYSKDVDSIIDREIRKLKGE